MVRIILTLIGAYIYERKEVFRSKLNAYFLIEIVSLVPCGILKYISTPTYLKVPYYIEGVGY